MRRHTMTTCHCISRRLVLTRVSRGPTPPKKLKMAQPNLSFERLGKYAYWTVTDRLTVWLTAVSPEPFGGAPAAVTTTM